MAPRAPWRLKSPALYSLFKSSFKQIKHQRHFQVTSSWDTVETRYNAVQFITIYTISFMALLWQEQNLNQTSNSQHTPHTSPFRTSYEVSIERIWDKIDRVITAPYCDWIDGPEMRTRLKMERGATVGHFSIKFLVHNRHKHDTPDPNYLVRSVNDNLRPFFTLGHL